MQITWKWKGLERNAKYIWNPHGTSYLMSRCNRKRERVEHLRTLVPTAKKAKGWAGLCAYQACQYLKRVLLFLWLYFRITTLFYHWYACVRRAYIRNKFSLPTVTPTSSTVFFKKFQTLSPDHFCVANVISTVKNQLFMKKLMSLFSILSLCPHNPNPDPDFSPCLQSNLHPNNPNLDSGNVLLS